MEESKKLNWNCELSYTIKRVTATTTKKKSLYSRHNKWQKQKPMNFKTIQDKADT